MPSSHGYADDTQLYVSFRPDSHVNQENTLSALEDCIFDVRAWLLSHKLMFKDSKTEFLVIGTPQQLSKVEIGHVNVGGVKINAVDSVRNLGSWFDKSSYIPLDHQHFHAGPLVVRGPHARMVTKW